MTLGLIRDLSLKTIVLGTGGDVTLCAKPADLESAYGALPGSFRVFLRIRPPFMMHREP